MCTIMTFFTHYCYIVQASHIIVWVQPKQLREGRHVEIFGAKHRRGSYYAWGVLVVGRERKENLRQNWMPQFA